MKIGKFHSPYMPNDGHGPGVPLPERLHRWLCTLNNWTCPIQNVLDSIHEFTDDEQEIYYGRDCGDFIEITCSGDEDDGEFCRHHWMGIKYDEVKDA